MACNQKALKLLGYEKDELLALNVFEITQSTNTTRSRQNLKKFPPENPAERFTSKIRTKDGEWRDIEVNSSALRDGAKIIGSMDIVRDITDVLLLRAELKQTQDAVHAASRAKSEFLANLSHEVRTPLNGITGIIPLLGREVPAGKGHEYLNLLQFSSDRLTALINQIFEFARLENKKLTLAPTPFALAEMLHHTVEILRLKAQEKNLAFTTSLDHDLPVWVVADHGRLAQILSNLVDNAIKFTDHGTISVDLRRPIKTASQSQLLVSISDTGIGIPKDRHDTIFNAFVQVDGSSTRRHSGLGLGLAIANELCRLMGGRLWVEDNPGGGTVFFSVWLDTPQESGDAPMTDARTTGIFRGVAPITIQRWQSVTALSPKKRNHHVLLVEDDEINRMLATEMLRDMGLEVTSVTDGIQAVRAVRSNPRFDAILMDLQMPHMDGITATTEIRKIETQENTRTPIIAVTAHSLDSDRAHCLASGMDDYVAKPFAGRQLRQVIGRFIPGLPSPTGREQDTPLSNPSPPRNNVPC